MDQFCIIANRSKEETFETSKWIMEYLKLHGKYAVLAQAAEEDKPCCYTDASKLSKEIQCAVVLGGDGTILQAAHDLLETNIPILGINMGTLGFLAEMELQEVEKVFQALFKDKYTIEERMMLDVSILCSEVSIQCFKKEDNRPKYFISSLNDVVITRSGFSRLITVGIYVNGAFVNNYRGDGVIISTPTGSTGYNLSAGGPVVTPEAELILITPICPHSLNTRSIVVSAADTVEILIGQSKKTQKEEAIVTVDGYTSAQLKAQDCIVVKKAEHSTRLLRVQGRNFFDILRTKLSVDGVY